mmetsp:Transcript_18576/g.8684  ORF Transcript_18576/g.8684 Transcript_18576/m.8684 type:complete len:226 (-) Transcript_18576:270-947(-)
MNYAKILARKDASHFTVVVAEKQKKGRGRLNRIWESEEGGLYFTIILKPMINSAKSFIFNFAASLSMARTLRKKFQIDAKLKWPNDILVDEKKICGMLSEMEAQANIISYINIGLGLNVNNKQLSKDLNAISVKEIVGKSVCRKEILTEFLDRFEKNIRKENLDHIIPKWKKNTITINRDVKIVTNNEVSKGFAVNIDETGALLLKLRDGSLKKVIYGDCFHQKC